MRRGVWRLILVGALSVTLDAAAFAGPNAGPNPGPNKSECIAAFDRAQRARTDKKLRQARTDLLVCTHERCSPVLRADCSGVLQTVESALPTIVFAADDGEGHDITDVKVFVDSDVIASTIDGRAIELDPGTYDFRFEKAGAPDVTVRRVVKEGEKARSVRASFPPPPSTRTSTSTSTSTSTAPATRSGAGYAVPIGLGVVGVLALGFAGYSRLQFDSDVDEMRNLCAPECSPSERADLSSTLVRSNVSLGVGIGVLALAVVSWFALQPSRTAYATSGWPTMIGRLRASGSW